MTADTNLSARLASLRAKATDDNLADEGHHFRDGMGYTDLTQCNHGDCGYFCNRGDGPLIAALWNAFRNGQLIPLADVEGMVKATVDAEREACAKMIEGSVYTVGVKGVRRLEPVIGVMAGMDQHHKTIATAIRARWVTE